MKELKLSQLKKKCQDMSNGPIVFGEGNLNAKLILVGEAPGAKEIELSKPFVGQAGKNLDEFIHILEIKREDIYITNTVKIRPYKINEKTGKKNNRPPNKKELEQYKDILFSEIEIIKPKILVSLGNHALKILCKDDKISIGEVHGKPFKKDNDYILFPLYHPAAVIYNKKLKDVYLNDLYKLKMYLEEGIENWL